MPGVDIYIKLSQTVGLCFVNQCSFIAVKECTCINIFFPSEWAGSELLSMRKQKQIRCCLLQKLRPVAQTGNRAQWDFMVSLGRLQLLCLIVCLCFYTCWLCMAAPLARSPSDLNGDSWLKKSTHKGFTRCFKPNDIFLIWSVGFVAVNLIHSANLFIMDLFGTLKQELINKWLN